MGAYWREGPRDLRGQWDTLGRKSMWKRQARGSNRRNSIRDLPRHPPGRQLMFFGAAVICILLIGVALFGLLLHALGGGYGALQDIRGVLEDIGRAFSRILKS